METDHSNNNDDVGREGAHPEDRSSSSTSSKGINTTLSPRSRSSSLHSRTSNRISDKLTVRPSLEEIAHQMERSLPIRNNRYRFRVYKDSFIGSECVDYLVRSNFARSRVEAVELGRRIASEIHLFEHVTLDHELKDGFYFYRFTNRTGQQVSL